MPEARAFWITGPGRGEIREEVLAEPRPGEILVQTLASGISRGSEALVFRGHVPKSQHALMRAPFQAGDFTFPLKYGYSNLGEVLAGPPGLKGQRVFCLYPHQDRYVVPVSAVVPVPDGLPSARAVLAANMETALNGLWDAGPRIGERIAVVGAGVVGTLVAALAAGIPGSEVELIDLDSAKGRTAAALGLAFAQPDEARLEADLVVHASGTSAGLATALGLAAFEATVLELSWYGDRMVQAPLGEAFHSRRLTLRSSQVGTVAAPMRARRNHAERLALALRLLMDDRFEALLEPALPFAELPERMPAITSAPGLLCQVVDYR